jgi:uncharacterized protein YprB with RNaseH-like and TPR domain
LDGLSGREAVQLWQAYRLGHDSALETLLRYNREDIINLKPLAGLAYKRLREKTTSLRPNSLIQGTLPAPKIVV